MEHAIARHPQHRQKMAVVDGGKHAITDAQVERCFLGQFSRLRLTLHTGRTHQIRVHLSHAGIPILGDSTYGRRFTPAKTLPNAIHQALQQLQRQALHAAVIGFTHPITREAIYCEAPLPDDLQTLNHALEQSLS